MSKHLTLFAVVLCGVLAAVEAKPDNLVVNPGFETGDFTGWTLSGTDVPDNSGSFYGVDTLDPNSGAYAAYFGPVGGILNLAQTFPTTPGTSYNVSFWLDQSPDTPAPYLNSFAISFAGATLFSAADASASSYAQYSFSGIAASNSADLVFAFRNDTGFFSLDDVSVATTPVPEPACFWVALLALSGPFLLRKHIP